MTANPGTLDRAKSYVLWFAAILGPIALQFAGNTASGTSTVGSPTLLFAIVLAAMALGAFGATKLVIRARRHNDVELGYLGLFFFAIAALSISHAITTPGVIIGQNPGTLSVWFWSIPIALVVGLPAILGRSRAGRAIDEEWWQWVWLFQIAIVAFSALVVIAPDVLPAVPTGTTKTVVVAISAGGCVLFSLRHLFLAQVARAPGPLVTALGFGLIGGSSLIWLDVVPYSVAFWLAHFLAIFGVIGGTVGALSTYTLTNELRSLVEPIVNVDPRSALEIGLEPTVQRFVADLEAGDPVRYEHVQRTTDLAMIVGRKLGLEGTALRDVGLTALLHDVGMMLIPSAILDKPGALDENEYEIVKRHSVYGERLMAESPAFKSIAHAVGSHHERIDGKGYPKGLAGPQVPLLSRIVSACDAFDALAHNRQYRPALDYEEAIEVLERATGTQFERRVVEVIVRTVRHQPAKSMPERLDSPTSLGCDCMPRLKAS